MNIELKVVLAIIFFLYALFNLFGYMFTNETLDDNKVSYKHSSKIHYELEKLYLKGYWEGGEKNEIM